MEKPPIYLDYNATTPVAPEVAETMRPFLSDFWGNPSSSHYFGRRARAAIEQARQQVADLLNCRTAEVVFTGGGTESNNMAIKGAAFANRQRGNHIITSQIEHPAVSEVCRYLEKNGFEVTYLPVDSQARVSVADVQNALRPETVLITIMHANNEVGTLQPIAEIGRIARQNGVVFHTDAAQSTGKIATDVQTLGVDLLSVAGHKLYAPKGVGALFIREGTALQKWMHGANHEHNRRPGTENSMHIAGLGKACDIARQQLEKTSLSQTRLRDLFYQKLQQHIPGLRLNGHPEQRLPNTLNVSFPGCEAAALLAKLPGIAASAGAACHADSVHISATLQAMGIPTDQAIGALRFSLGKYSTAAEIELAVAEIARACRQSVHG